MPKLRSKKIKNRYVVDARDIGAGEPRFKSRGEALAWIEKSTHDSFGGVFIDPNKSVLFEQCLVAYIEAEKIRMADGEIGLAEFNNRVRSCNHFRSLDWNGKALSEVKATDLKFGLLKTHLLPQFKKRWAKATCQKMLVHFKQVFVEAKAQDYIRVNEAAELKIGKVIDNDISKNTVEDISNLTHDNVSKILTAADDKYYLIIKTVAMTGLRCSELVALIWEQIEFGDNENDGRLYVDRALKRTENVVGDPKTKAGSRVIYLTADLRKELMNWKISQPLKQRANNLVFPSREGTLADYGNWRNRGLYPTCKKAGVPNISFRLLRHFFASILIFDTDLTEGTITEMMGHTDISFTKRQYATWLRKSSRDQESSAKLSNATNQFVIRRK